jgi:hypothetical protein
MSLECAAPVAVSVRAGYVRMKRSCDPNGSCAERRVNRIAGTIKNLLFTGERQEACVAVGDGEVLLDLPRDGGWREGEAVILEFDPRGFSECLGPRMFQPFHFAGSIRPQSSCAHSSQGSALSFYTRSARSS